MNDRMHRGQLLTFEAIASQYPPDKFILLLPQVSRHLLTTVPMWSLDVATVKCDPADSSHAYEIGYNSGEYGLTKTTIDALATAADITVTARRSDDKANRMFAEYESHAIMQTPSGGMRGQGRTCEWDGEVAREKKQREAEQWFARKVGQSNANWRMTQIPGGQRKDVRNMTQDEAALVIEDHFKGEWLREQEFGKRMVESKAANRAVRALLGIKAKYKYDELRDKEFAVVRFVFTPDLEDRETRLLVVGAGLQAQRFLYPGVAGNVPAQLTMPTALPAPVPQPDGYGPVGDVPALPAAEDEGEDVGGGMPAEMEAEELDREWEGALSILPNIMKGIQSIENAGTRTKLNNRLAKAIQNEDGLQLHKIMDYLLSQEEGGSGNA